MKVDGTNNMSGMAQAPMTQNMDAESKNIQKLIQNKQQELQSLSESERMSPEEKMKKRQEIQQEINSLNMQLRQHQIEQRKEQQSKGTSMDDMLGGQPKARPHSGNGSEKKADMMSQASMKGMISADVSMQQAQVQGSVATRMEDRAGVLKAEIARDKATGANTEQAEKELAEVEEKAQNAAAAQMGNLGVANETLEEAREEERQEKAEKENAENAVKTKESGKRFEENGSVDTSNAEAAIHSGEVSVQKNTTGNSPTYVTVDVRL